MALLLTSLPLSSPQVCFNSHTLQPFAKMGDGSDMMIVDSQELCAPGESLNFWELLRRAQLKNSVRVQAGQVRYRAQGGGGGASTRAPLRWLLMWVGLV